MSFVGGLMLGIALLHLLPHSAELLDSPATACTAALFGLVGMFLLIRLFHQHHHHGPESSDLHVDCKHEHHIHSDQHHEHQVQGGVLEHPARHTHEFEVDTMQSNGLGWLGMLFGMGLHTLVDGVALAASVLAEAHHGPWLGLAGLGTFLAIALHKPLDAFAITSTMQAHGWTHTYQNLANVLFSMACPIGATIFYFGTSYFSASTNILGWGLAISAGFFICIALADLLPEVAFHDHDRGKLTLALFAGITLAFAVENLPGHDHDLDHSHDHYAQETAPSR